MLHNCLNYPAEILLLIFLIITFLQSGIDKVMDWKGNLSWLKEHFKNSPLAKGVPVLLGIVLVVEVAAGLLCTIGLYQLLVTGSKLLALYGAMASGIALLLLLFGQRMAKDYAGAMTIVVYFMPTVFLLYLLQR